ncbi:MAG: hypothetical protein P0111_04120 [Nitrospira sp.]|nr:hypothetical protein [Nitrospira sp.]
MSRLFFIVMVLVSLIGVSPANAAQMSRPQAEYSADETIQNEEGTIRQRVYVTPTKERKELLTGAGEGAVQIFRYDTRVMWQVMPSEKMYMEHSISGGRGQGNDPSQWTYEDTAMGEETLSGVRVTKYKTIATSTDGKKYGGFSWRTSEGISIKQDLLYKEGKETKRMFTELTNVQIGRQDPKLFEIPEGFTKFDMGGMMGMSGMGRQEMGQSMGRPDMSGTPPPSTRRPGSRPEVVTPQETQPAPEPEAPAEESTADKAGNFMKGLFGR